MDIDTLWLRSAQEPSEISSLRDEIRRFLRAEIESGAFVPRCNSWLEGHDPSFSRRVADRGWLGWTWPKRYGGRARSGIERFAILEELLAAGAPVAAHWIAERQTGPSLLRFGTEQQRERFLPAIARGECYFAIGMSEPDSGSDLASVRTEAHRADDCWIVSGSKVWTSHAAKSHFSVVLCRTSPRGSDRHSGLSQLIVDLSSPGVEVRPIQLMGGGEHFAEVLFDSVRVPGGMLLGAEGDGWHQVTAELAHERSGPERFLSTFPLLVSLGERVETSTDRGTDAVLGLLFSELWSLHTMSREIARQLDLGSAPQVEAAMVKDLGTQFENAVVDAANSLEPVELLAAPSDEYGRRLAQSVVAAPGFTIRGGTTEVLRGVIAKEFSA